MIGIIAKMKVKEGKAEEFMQKIKELATHVREEEGTLFYTLNRDPANPNVFVFMERYRDKDALRSHSRSPHFLAMFQNTDDILEGKPEISILDEVVSI